MPVLPVRTPEDATFDVVFMHGLDGDARKSWQRDKSASTWHHWLADDIDGLAVWSVGYDAFSSRWRGRAMPLQDRAINLLAQLQSSNIGDRPLIFIAHSMGGLLIKEMLLHAAGRHNNFTKIAHATKGVVFLSTPHAGSGLTKAVEALKLLYRGTPAVEDLRQNSAYLRQLDTRYREWANEVGLKHLVFFETHPTKGVQVVDQTSADLKIAGTLSIPVDANHVNISKPNDRTSVVYGPTKRFIVAAQQSPDAAKATSERLNSSIAASDRATPYELFRQSQLEVLVDLINPSTWRNRLDGVFRAGQSTIAPSVLEELKEVGTRIRIMPWPRQENDEILSVTKALGQTIDAFVTAFETRADMSNNLYIFPKFYRQFSTDGSQRRAQEQRYLFERSLMEDLLLEVTRYVNWFSDLAQEELGFANPSLHQRASLNIEEHGRTDFGLVVPEFSNKEKTSGRIPLSTPMEFATDRYTRGNFSPYWKRGAPEPAPYKLEL